MDKIVLNNFGEAWGYVDVATSTREVRVFCETTINGAPVNVKTRKVSAAKKYKKQLERHDDHERFTRYEYHGIAYYRY